MIKKFGIYPLLALLWSSLAHSAMPAENATVPISLAISGGISLGSYEAGLNWAVIHQLKLMRQNPDLRSDKYPARLAAIAGASAGGINALVSAMSWCMDDQLIQNRVSDTVTSNLFRDIWLDVGFKNLLPENPRAYSKNDGLLSRRAFDQIINRIRILLDEPVYRNDCALPIALTVTRTEPIVMEVEGIRVRNQRFVIPFILKSSSTEPGKISLESYIVDPANPMLGNVIYLQSTRDNKIILDKESVINAVLATSAFPVAFGRVHLEYCLAREDANYDPPSSNQCPQNYYPTSGDFVDGGVFDNVPLGVARALTELQSRPDDAQYNYIYLDPGSRRPVRQQNQKSATQTNGFGLTSQLYFLGGAITSGEEYELYNVLRSADWSGTRERKILLTSRHPPITGEFLAHFGAFIDEAFREYDYYAGVYDGINNIARYRCYRQNENMITDNKCLAEQAQLVYNGLFPVNSLDQETLIARAVIAQLAQHEFQNTVYEDKWQWAWANVDMSMKSNVLLVSSTLIAVDKADSQTDPELRDFIARLPDSYDLTNSDYIIRRILKLRHDDELKWFYPLASRASLRLLELEKQEQALTGDSLRGLMGLAAFGVESALGEQKNFVWNQSTAKNNWYQLLPYELSYDVSNTGWGISWEPSWQFNRPWSLNTKLTPYAAQRSFNQHTIFNQVDFFISHQNQSSLFSSWGVGPSYNHQRQDRAGIDRANYGISAYAGFFSNKLRLTIGKRAESGGFFGDEIYLYIGITDIPGMSYWTRQTYW
jgi:predicted acylesterase/phospholipase RssA